MKYAVVSLIAVLLQTTAFANHIEKSRAAALARQYEKASFISSLADRSGWYTGRCYMLADPDKPVGTLLMIDSRTRSGRNGPMFDADVPKFVFAVQNSSFSSPSAYDAPTVEMISHYSEYLSKVFENDEYSVAFERDRAQVSEFKLGDARWSIRHDGKYFFGRVAKLNGDLTSGYCYFFKRVH
jgi:hypothetical protein